MNLNSILRQLGLGPGMVTEVSPFLNEEDGEEYSVWKITAGAKTYVLKQAKEYEREVYTTFLSGNIGYGPRLFGVAEQEGRAYLLMEYVPGENLRYGTRKKLIKALDALIAMQEVWWEKAGLDDAAFSVQKALPGRIRRGKYLNDDRLEKAYRGYLALYGRLPKTLCHDDLLPFNVLISQDRAVLIDWEYAGMQPYLSPLARLIAHGEEGENAFFHMKSEDRAFAIEYYYEHLVRGKGISYEDYRSALDYFLLYEYCEWIMLGNRYGSTDSERCIRYRALALELIPKLHPIKEEPTWK